ncbi:probable sulfate transporter 3.5 [Magnolia sinica]|uniref:probable sulfate transporter 3.5 n=1 Tax=Magnolia sinica TaxID=86752 RepID=UPI002659513E|nr:probable sulfate transporter 3.5 [Magnolia sinica]
MEDTSENPHKVNLNPSRSFGTVLKSSLKETFFPDDPFRQFKNDPPATKALGFFKYYIPIVEWAPKYSLSLFKFDLLSGITIASLAIPQGISYAKLADVPPIIGLYSSFVPPIIYALFGSSKHLAVGTVAACSLLLNSSVGAVASPTEEPTLYLHLIFTATFFTGIVQTIMGLFRLGIVVDFLSHSTILGFMAGTATIVCLQQLKGILGLTHFTTKTDVVSVLHAVFSLRNEWRWQCAVVGIAILAFLLGTRQVRKRCPKLFWVSAVGPLLVVVLGCLLAFLLHADKHGFQIVGPLKKGINPPSIKLLNFDSRYIAAVVKAGTITGILALAEGIAIGRSFAAIKNYNIDGNKEMIAFGLMNLVGSLTSCYLTTGPFSKSAVNSDAGCKTQMSNVVMAICMMLILLFLAPLFSYTPQVALSAIIMAAMLGLIEYKEAYHLFKVDKFDFIICMAAFFGVAFMSMDTGLMISVGISLLRALLYMARPGICKLGNLPNTRIYRDMEQYPGGKGVPGMLILQLGSHIYFANAGYVRERVTRWIYEEQDLIRTLNVEDLQYVILDISGIETIDTTGIEMLEELRVGIEKKGIKVVLVNPRMELVEKFAVSNLLDTVGKEMIYLTVPEAVAACEHMLRTWNKKDG